MEAAARDARLIFTRQAAKQGARELMRRKWQLLTINWWSLAGPHSVNAALASKWCTATMVNVSTREYPQKLGKLACPAAGMRPHAPQPEAVYHAIISKSSTMSILTIQRPALPVICVLRCTSRRHAHHLRTFLSSRFSQPSLRFPRRPSIAFRSNSED